MYDFKKNTCIVVEFASLDGVFTDLYDSKTKKIEFRLFSAYRDRGGEDRKGQNSGALYKFYSA